MMTLISPKYTLQIYLSEETSKVRAIQAISNVTGMSLLDSQFMLSHTSTLSIRVRGHYEEIWMTAEEIDNVKKILAPYFESFHHDEARTTIEKALYHGSPFA